MSDFASMLNRLKCDASSAAAASGSLAKRKRPCAASTSIPPSRKGGDSFAPSADGRGGSDLSRVSPLLYPSKMPPVWLIYVVCPAFAETGGPEALHQLCHVLNNLDDKGSSTETWGVPRARAVMLYLRERGNALEHVCPYRSKPSKYDRYDAPAAMRLPGRGRDADDQYGENADGGRDGSSITRGLEVDGTRGKTNSAEEEKDVRRFDDDNNDDGEACSGEYSNELVIWPECWTHLIDSLQPSSQPPMSSSSSAKEKLTRKIYRYQIAIWWLSVNNNKRRFSSSQFRRRIDVLHLVQSMYARNHVCEHLRSEGKHAVAQKKENACDEEELRQRRVLDVTEFIPCASETSNPAMLPEPPRDLEVVFNPVKGMHFTDEIMRRANHGGGRSGSGGGMTFTPIGKGQGGQERMTGEEVAALLIRARVYIDFGPHPGMDRLPREAAMAGCIVITNREGAAGYDTDVPIPNRFKFGIFDADGVVLLLKECLERHDEVTKEFDSYREWIRGQEEAMKRCAARLVDEVATDRLRQRHHGISSSAGPLATIER